MLEATFEIVTGRALWGQIEGDIQDQADLQEELQSISGGLSDSIIAVDNKYDSITGALNDSIIAVDNKYDSITGALSDSITGLDNKYDSITGALSDSITGLDNKYDSITGALSDSITGLDNKYDSITGALGDSIVALDSIVSDNFTTLSDSITALDSVVSSNFTTLSDSIIALDSVVSSNFTTLSDSITNNYNTLDSLIGGVDDKIDNHIANTANPHSVTKTQVGLGNVDNTSDLDKPVSTAQQTALDGKVDKNADITAATKCKITYDVKGLVTGGADLQQSDIPSLNLTKISDVTATATEVNQLHESGAVKADFEKLHDVTADAAELNVLDGVTASTSEINTLDGLTASTAELNILDGATLSTTELNYVDGVTSSIQTQLDAKLAIKPDGTNDLINNNNKINIIYVPDVILGQMLYAGTFIPTTAVATLSTNAQTRLGTTSQTITLTNDTTPITGYTANEGNYYIASANGTFANIVFEEGDWLVATADSWGKILNTDAVTGIKGNAESTYRIGNVNITADNVLPTQTNNAGKALITNGTTASWGNSVTSISQGSANGTIAVSVNGGAASDVSVKGLGSAAYTASTAYATSTQGGKADSAIQSVKVNGSALTPDANKAVDVTVPTKISDLSDDTATYPIDKADTLTGLTATIAELNYVDGVTSSIQTQLNGKQESITGGASTITSSNLTASKALVSNASGKVDVSTVTSTELGYVSGVTSDIQTQLNSKLTTSDIVSSVSSSSTNSKAVGAKLFYDTCGDIETLINAL